MVYLCPTVLAIDEIGYRRLNREETELLFRLVSKRYEHGSIILTSNKYFDDWGGLLSDAIIDTDLLDQSIGSIYWINYCLMLMFVNFRG